MSSLLFQPPRLQRQDPIAQGLVGYWPMWSGAGDVIYDIAGRHNATRLGTTKPRWSSHLMGEALEFFDSANKVRVFEAADDIPEYESQMAVTWEMWVYHNTLTVDHDLLCEESHTIDSKLLVWADYDGSPTYTFIFNGSGVVDTGATVDVNAWTHLVFTFEAQNRFRFFKDGVESSSSPIATAVADSGSGWGDFDFGNAIVASSKTLDGYLSHVVYWNRVLAPGEVRALYEDPYRLIAPPTNRVWSFLSGGGATAMPMAIHHYKMSGGL